MKLLVVVLAVAVCSVAIADAFRLRREEAAPAAAADAEVKPVEGEGAAAEGEKVDERYGYRPRPGYSSYTSQTYTSVQQGGGYGAGYTNNYNPAYAGGGGAAYGNGYGPGYTAGAAGYGPGASYVGGAGYGPGAAYGLGVGAGYGAGAAYSPTFGASVGDYSGGINSQYGAVPNVNFQSVGPNGRPAVSYESPNFGFYLRDKNAAKDGAGAAAAAAEKPKEEGAVAFGSR